MSGQSTGVLGRLRQPVDLRRGPHQLVGGSPRVSLLPSEVRLAGVAAVQRRKLVAAVALVAIVAVGGVAIAHSTAVDAQARLAAVTRQAQILNAQAGKFDDVKKLQAGIALGRAGVEVGSSTMIDWNAEVDAIESGKPDSYTVTSISANGATPFALYPQGTSLLTPVRAATIELKLTSPTVGDEFSTWYRSLRDIPSYADANATTSYDSTNLTWSIDLTVHLTAKAISAGAWKDES